MEDNQKTDGYEAHTNPVTPEEYLVKRLPNATRLKNETAKGLQNSASGVELENIKLSFHREVQDFYYGEDSNFKGENVQTSLRDMVELSVNPSESQWEEIRETGEMIPVLAKSFWSLVNEKHLSGFTTAKQRQQLKIAQDVMINDPVINSVIIQELIDNPIMLGTQRLFGDNLADLGIIKTMDSVSSDPSLGNTIVYEGEYLKTEDSYNYEQRSASIAEGATIPLIDVTEEIGKYRYSTVVKKIGYAIEQTYEQLTNRYRQTTFQRLQVLNGIKDAKSRFWRYIDLAINGAGAVGSGMHFILGGPSNIIDPAPSILQSSVVLSDGTSGTSFAGAAHVAGAFNPVIFISWLKDQYLKPTENLQQLFSKMPDLMVCNAEVYNSIWDSRTFPVTDLTITVGDLIQKWGVSIEMPPLMGNIRIKIVPTSKPLGHKALLLSSGMLTEIVQAGSEIREIARNISSQTVMSTYTSRISERLDPNMYRAVYDYSS